MQSISVNPLQFCPSMPLLAFPVFCLSSSIVLNRYFHILVNSMTIWSVLKLPKAAWPSPFNQIMNNGVSFQGYHSDKLRPKNKLQISFHKINVPFLILPFTSSFFISNKVFAMLVYSIICQMHTNVILKRKQTFKIRVKWHIKMFINQFTRASQINKHTHIIGCFYWIFSMKLAQKFLQNWLFFTRICLWEYSEIWPIKSRGSLTVEVTGKPLFLSEISQRASFFVSIISLLKSKIYF